MNINKAVIANVVAKLEGEQRALRRDIERGKRDVKLLVERQATRKRELGVLQDLIRSIAR
jgi:hypothetical protein